MNSNYTTKKVKKQQKKQYSYNLKLVYGSTYLLKKTRLRSLIISVLHFVIIKY